MKTNILKYYCDILGEGNVIDAVSKARLLAKTSKFSQVTNPILRFLIHTTRISGDKIHSVVNMKVPPDDYVKYKFTGSIMHMISEEILENPNYRDEAIKGLLGAGGGSAMTIVNEMTVAAFYKDIMKYKVVLSSSAEKGMPDVLLPDEEFSSDAKTAPNDRFLLTEVINDCRDEFEACFKDVADGSILIFVLKPNKVGLKKSLSQLSDAIKADNFKKYEDEFISVIVIWDGYKGGDMKVEFPDQNLHVVFQANWAMDQAVADLEEHIEKSISQTRKAGKNAVTWIMFPVDASRNGIEITVLRAVEDYENKVNSTVELDGIILYSLEHDTHKKNVAAVVDVYGDRIKALGINKDQIVEFLAKVMNKKEYVRKSG